MVDHELGRHERVDLRRVASHLAHRVAHRREVDDGGDAGEVLHDHPRRGERDLLARLVLGVPGRERLDVLGADRLAVLVAQQVLEQDLQRERQPGNVESRLERVESEDLVGAVTDAELRPGVEAVICHLGVSLSQVCLLL